MVAGEITDEVRICMIERSCRRSMDDTSLNEFGLAESRVLLYPKFVRVPVKMRKVIRASRERCLALEFLG